MSDKKAIYIFDHVRANSQLFNKLFAAHPQLEQVFMPLIGASLYGPEAVFRGRRHSQTTEDTFQGLADASDSAAKTETYAAAVERMERTISGIHEKVGQHSQRGDYPRADRWQGKVPWIKDHAFCVIPREIQDAWTTGSMLSDSQQRNPTVFSDEFLDNAEPVFLIRHPALNIPSFLRKNRMICKNQAGDEDFAIFSAIYWSRLVFDSYMLRSRPINGGGNMKPVVIDAADVVYDTENVIRALCDRLEIDFSGVQFSWPPLPDADWPSDGALRTFFKELFLSTGVERRAERVSPLFHARSRKSD